MKKDNTASVLINILEGLNIPVTEASVVNELQKHPEQSSLFAINDLLNYWKVPNGAFNISAETLSELPTPCIVHLSSNNGEFAVVNRRDGENVYVSNERWSNYKISIEDFKNIFSGNVLIAQFDQDAGEMDFREKRRKEAIKKFRFPFFLSGFIVLFLCALFQYSPLTENLTWPIALIAILKTTGLITAVLLMVHSFDSNNSFTQRICSGHNNDCNAILTSKAAKVTDYLSWSEVGLFYYTGSWLTLLFNTQSAASLQLLAYISVLCLPYTFYSIYYQWQIARQWCVFCCAIQALFWLEFFAFSPFWIMPLNVPSLKEIINISIEFSVPVFLWASIKPLIEESARSHALSSQLKKFKYNKALFFSTLKEQPHHVFPELTQSVLLGNPEAEHMITLVSSPTCEPCAEVHKLLHQWQLERDNFKLQLVFAVMNEDNDYATKIVKHLLSLKDSDSGRLEQAVHEWYEGKYKDLDSWKKAYPAEEKKDAKVILEKYNDWCKMADVKGTPTVFLNGYQLPAPWQLEDIKYFI